MAGWGREGGGEIAQKLAREGRKKCGRDKVPKKEVTIGATLINVVPSEEIKKDGNAGRRGKPGLQPR